MFSSGVARPSLSAHTSHGGRCGSPLRNPSFGHKAGVGKEYSAMDGGREARRRKVRGRSSRPISVWRVFAATVSWGHGAAVSLRAGAEPPLHPEGGVGSFAPPHLKERYFIVEWDGRACGRNLWLRLAGCSGRIPGWLVVMGGPMWWVRSHMVALPRRRRGEGRRSFHCATRAHP